MSFAEKSLQLFTDCQRELVSYKESNNLFGYVITKEESDKNGEACDSIRYRIEEYEDYDEGCLIHDGKNIQFNFDEPLFMTHFIDPEDKMNFEKFVTNLLNYKYVEVADGYLGTRVEAFLEDIQETGLPSYLLVAFNTAYENSVIGHYLLKYEDLKKEYPGLLYYPRFSHSFYEESDYYESSTC